MNLPIVLLGTVISLLYGSIYHFWKGGKISRLLLFLILSLVGFWAGHLIGAFTKITFASIGELNTGMATLVSVAFLFIGDWLSLVNIQRK